jgi:hypothetical protein
VVGNDGEAVLLPTARHARAGHFIDIFDPLVVRLEGVGREPDQLDIALREFRRELCKGSQLGRTNWSEVGRVAKQNGP